MNKNREEKYTRKGRKSLPRTMLRFLSTLITLGIVGYGAWWLNDAQPQFKEFALTHFHFGRFTTLEPRFSPKQILAKKQLSSTKDKNISSLEPVLEFHPYLLMSIKFTDEEETKEGVILWDLNEGEMVLNTKEWKTTHGFSDCINAKASPYEYKIISTIAHQKGKADYSTLISTLDLEKPLADMWIKKCQQKKLIVKEKNYYRIHLQNPRFHILPVTHISSPLITKHQKQSKRLPRRYSPFQIKKAAQSAFGLNFAIRSTQEIFLPVYVIKSENSDGSLHTTFWNALNGQQMDHHLTRIESTPS